MAGQDLSSWAQALIFLAMELLLSGLIKKLEEHRRLSESTALVMVGAIGVSIGTLYWIRLPAGINHSPIILVPFLALTIWLLMDLHSRHKVQNRIVQLEGQLRTQLTSSAPGNPPSAAPNGGDLTIPRATPASDTAPAFTSVASQPADARPLHHTTASSGVSLSLDTIGVIRSVRISFERSPNRYECECDVDFHSIGSPCANVA